MTIAVICQIGLGGHAWVAAAEELDSFLNTHCSDCHSGPDASAGFDIDHVSSDQGSFPVEAWELMHRRLLSRQMPPPDAERPSEQEYVGAIERLERRLDQHATAFPTVGTVPTLRRLTRTEYQNAIRDLLAVKIDASTWLPADESSGGFDNITVGELSPTLISRYVTAAQVIARTALGRRSIAPEGITVRVPADRTQESHQSGLPLGTRGGTSFEHTFGVSGEYEIELKLTRDRDEKVEGLNEEHQLDVLIDRVLRHRFTVKPPPKRNDYTHSDSHLRTRLWIDAGTREVVVTFPQKFQSLIESGRQPFDARFNRHRHPRITPALFQVSLVGPLSSATEDAVETESRKIVLGDNVVPEPPASPEQARMVAEQIVERLSRRAFRRAVDRSDIESAMFFFDQGYRENGFDAGIESALSSILVNPNFLFRIESTPTDAIPGKPYRIDDFELASRLSFFLWSSLPDDRLLDLAQAERLNKPESLRNEVARMLADQRSEALATNFASQWLYLRNLDSMTPDLRLFPDFDDNLRQAMRMETEMLFSDIMRGNRSVLDLINADYTFLNERLATHYGIPGILGSDFRKVELPVESIRGGILRHGSILTVTSYATRTSPTIRGHWVLKNILGTPTPPPPANVPALKEKSTVVATSVRERLARHREDPACASCHDLMDPIGFALENFDAVGRYRVHDDTLAIDSSGVMPDGAEIDGVDALEDAILERPELFITNLTEKFVTYGIGRIVGPTDGTHVRKIVQSVREDDDRFETLIQAIVASDLFTHRNAL
ncbi:hypothetical protein Pla100_39240 [Neorhodopirellula pilleata]|uniref:Planctomycete cytochrome C n=2 Tax=Neorhodopirellula pilleata TaxID=2714738 RepID=A0A5C6A7N7_9BACT|nr:hypothetical protein Pla100_39240 [Neorhodopirellula pilleata]